LSADIGEKCSYTVACGVEVPCECFENAWICTFPGTILSCAQCAGESSAKKCVYDIEDAGVADSGGDVSHDTPGG
jgi:hypothetical protein